MICHALAPFVLYSRQWTPSSNLCFCSYEVIMMHIMRQFTLKFFELRASLDGYWDTQLHGSIYDGSIVDSISKYSKYSRSYILLSLVRWMPRVLTIRNAYSDQNVPCCDPHATGNQPGVVLTNDDILFSNHESDWIQGYTYHTSRGGGGPHPTFDLDWGVWLRRLLYALSLMAIQYMLWNRKHQNSDGVYQL